MLRDGKFLVLCLSALTIISTTALAEVTERLRPEGWENIVFGGRFMDRILPSPVRTPLVKNTWGSSTVKPRDTSIGIEDDKWSYWGGSIKQSDDGTFNLFVARWSESHPRGHGASRLSHIIRAESPNPWGPFKKVDVIGNGHNPEIFQTKGGHFAIYAVNSYYYSESMKGPWKRKKLSFDKRGRNIPDGLNSLSFVSREDGSVMAVCRGGGIWLNESGTGTWQRVNNQSIYPKVEGRFEDPVIWRTDVQYHMVVNDWFGRIAWYLRSKDGINWVTEQGEAYTVGLDRYENGTKVDWYKYERMRVLQDEYGRAYQANFAVIDTVKRQDKPNDIHSSKNITVPLVVGRRIEILNRESVITHSSDIQVKVYAEEGFNPHLDLDIKTLRFGASGKVNFGGGSKVKKVSKSGSDLILSFNGKDTGFTKHNFAGKLLGKTSEGELLFGWSRLPGVQYEASLLSGDMPKAKLTNGMLNFSLDVKNFGLYESPASNEKLAVNIFDGQKEQKFTLDVPKLQPYEKTTLTTEIPSKLNPASSYRVIVQSVHQTMPVYKNSNFKKYLLKISE